MQQQFDEFDDGMVETPTDDTPSDDTYESRLRREYWPAMGPKEFASEAESRFEEHYQAYQQSGIAETIFRSYRMYHSMDPRGFSEGFNVPRHSPSFIGEQGEFVYTEINHYRNHILHQKALVLSERPAFEAHASTNDADALEQVDLADHILQYAMDHRGIAQRIDTATERALVESGSWIRLDWDAHQRDMLAECLGVVDVAYQRSSNIEEAEWAIARTRAPRWRLAAEAKAAGDDALALAVLDATPSSSEDRQTWTRDVSGDGDTLSRDMIEVLHVYCPPTPQLPEGRYARVLPGGVVLEDVPFPFREIPLYPIMPNMFLGSTTPYSNSWDLMPLQTLENACISAMSTRMDAFGVPNVACEEGTEVGVHENGLATWFFPPGSRPPQILDWMSNNPGLTQFVSLLESMGDKISGVNSVVRGQPAENISSGSMAALVEAQAVKFNSPLDRAVTYATERVGTGVIRMYQSFATEDMLLSITGSTNGERVVRTFQAQDIDKIHHVSVQRTNPLTRTNAWKQDAANQMLAQGVITEPHEFLAVTRTGRYSAIFDDSIRIKAHIDDENSRLLAGELIEANDMERHDLHVKEHVAQLDSRTRDYNPKAAQAIYEHCMDHISKWTQLSIANPGILMATGVPQPLPPPLAAQQSMQAAGMAPAGQPAPEQPPGKPGPDPKGKVQGKTAAGADRLPDMPKPAKAPTERG